MTDRELMQQALEALDKCQDWPGAHEQCSRAVHALRERLAQPECVPDDRMAVEWDDITREFFDWWDADLQEATNPFRRDTPAYWAWAGWKAAIRARGEP